MSWIVKDTSREDPNERECDSRAEAEETKDDMVALGASPDDIEIIPPQEDIEPEIVDQAKAADGGTEVVEEQPTPEQMENDPDIITSVEDLDEKPASIDEDPIDWVPSHFVDDIQGVPTINRKGYCVLAERYGVSVKAEPVTLPSETDFEYAEFRAVAETEDGQEYTGFGSAHVDRQDGDDPHLLGELAETRALKRATAWATGIGMTAIEELQGGLE